MNTFLDSLLSPYFILMLTALIIVGIYLYRHQTIREFTAKQVHNSDGSTAIVPYDPAQTLTNSALALVGVLVVFICVIISVQIFKSGEANTESWAALTGIIGWVTGVAQMLFSNRFGSTRANSIKDGVIATQAQTAAAIAGVVAPLNPDLPQVPIKAGDVSIEAQTATVTTQPATEEK